MHHCGGDIESPLVRHSSTRPWQALLDELPCLIDLVDPPLVTQDANVFEWVTVDDEQIRS